MPTVTEKLKRKIDRVKNGAATTFVIESIEHIRENLMGSLLSVIKRSA